MYAFGGLIVCLLLSACQSITQPNIHDDTLELKKEQYEDLLLSNFPQKKE